MTMTMLLGGFDSEDVISQDAESCFLSQFSVAFSVFVFFGGCREICFSSEQHVLCLERRMKLKQDMCIWKGRESLCLGSSLPKHSCFAV